MRRVELAGFSLSIGGHTVINQLDLVIEPGAVLAIVGRSGSGKTLLAEALAGLAGSSMRTGRAVLAHRAVLVSPDDDLPALESRLVRRPELIVADEPGAMLDPEPRRQLLTALLVAARDLKASLVILTRDIRLPMTMELDTAVLAQGCIVERGPAAALADRPRHDATIELLGAERPRTRTLARPPVSEALLAFDGVTRRYPARGGSWLRRPENTIALEGVSFTVRRGEAVGVLGGAGAGKSTLLRLAAGLGRVQAGHLTLGRNDYRGNDLPDDARARLAMIFPDPHAAFNPELPVGVSLTEPLRLEQHLLIDEQADGLAEAVRVVGFEPDVLDRLPGSFTAAQLQRLALARALAGRPALVLLDEPTLALDPVDRAEFLTVFNRIRSDYGITVLIASRHMSVLRLLVDRVHVLERGRIVETGTPSQLQLEAGHPATRALLASPYPGPLPPVEVQPVVLPVEVPPEPVSEAPVPEPVAEPVPEPPAEILAAPVAEPVVDAAPSAPVEPVKLPPPPPSAEPADEGAESREAQFAVEGHRHRAGRVEAADDDTWG